MPLIGITIEHFIKRNLSKRQKNKKQNILLKGGEHMEYEIKWAVIGLHKGDAQKCYNECQTLNEVTPQSVLEKARNKKTELHKCFEWDDSIASEKYRLIQARQIIQHFVIIHNEGEENEQKIRSYQITTETTKYEKTELFLQKPDEYAALLERAKAELVAFKNRYRTLTELESIFAEIDALNE